MIFNRSYRKAKKNFFFNFLSFSFSQDESSINIFDYDKLLTSQWFEHHIFRFIQMISDHCRQASIAVVGLLMKNENFFFDDQAEQILDDICSSSR